MEKLNQINNNVYSGINLEFNKYLNNDIHYKQLLENKNKFNDALSYEEMKNIELNNNKLNFDSMNNILDNKWDELVKNNFVNKKSMENTINSNFINDNLNLISNNNSNSLYNINKNNNFYLLNQPKVVHPMLNEFNNYLSNLKTNQNILKDNDNNKSKDEDKDKNVNEDKYDENVYQDIVNVLESQDDERQHNSEFLKFVKNLRDGNIELNEKDNKVDINNNYENYEQIFSNINNTLSNNQNIFKTNINNNKYNNDEFINVDKLELAKKLLSEFKTQDAREVLESELNKNEKNSDAWILLAKIHSDYDDDNSAYYCLSQAYKEDKYNSDCLHSLGISCTNVTNEFEAMINLLEYVKMHPIYSEFYNTSNFQHNKHLDYNLIRKEIDKFSQMEFNYYDYNNKEELAKNNQVNNDNINYIAQKDLIKNMENLFYEEVVNLYNSLEKNLNIEKDSDFYMSLGIVNFIPNNNNESIAAFKKAVNIAPKDYNCWNKLGAIYAHSGMNNLAIECYLNAINLKPDYLRCFVNLSLAYKNENQLNNSIKSCINALRIKENNPDVWLFLRSIFIEMSQKDTEFNNDISMCDKQDLKYFTKKYNFY